ncbi:NAD(P)-binding protein [Phaeosphaeriaceae sp. SRC1lsM3a]|nr:NAD(P)-binding protein [Stagonospora sp. SRC1lsM3a]
MDCATLTLGLEGRSVIVTGGAGLIGRVVVDHFIAAGAKVSSLDIAHPKSPQDGPADSSKHAAGLKAIHCDVADEESVHQAFATATQAHGSVDVCVALASLDLSVLKPAEFADASLEQLQRVLDVNVIGTWLTARAWFRGLRQAKQDGMALQHPNLIIIGSESGHFGERHAVDYSLGKSAVQGGLLMSLRAEAPRVWPGARVNVVAPGPVETDRWHIECKQNPDQLYLEAQATVMIEFHSPTPFFPSTYASVPSSRTKLTASPRLHYASLFLSELLQWPLSRSQATTSAAIYTAK